VIVEGGYHLPEKTPVKIAGDKEDASEKDKDKDKDKEKEHEPSKGAEDTSAGHADAPPTHDGGKAEAKGEAPK
jgi:hypothetical protein